MINIKKFFRVTINVCKAVFLSILQMSFILMLYDSKFIKANNFTLLIIFVFVVIDIMYFVQLCQKK